jgi:BirA family transcriptional regulator, biotin operon repressor / biotin---[acetyl-CoA-carboxylase] ligase
VGVAHARVTATQTLAHIRLPDGWRIMPFDVLDSTNSALRRMLEAGTEAGEGLIVTAKAQTAGRGRGGRAWASPVGNLFASFLIQSREGLARAPEIGFVAAVAVLAAIQVLLPDRTSDASLKCKWPNDVLFDGAKISGILLETAHAPDHAGVYVVLGIGLNLVPVELPHATYKVTSLAEHGGRVGLAQALEALAKQLFIHLEIWRRDGFSPIRKIWLDHAAGLKDMITVQLPSEMLTGRFVDVDPDGALVVEQKPGQRRRVLAGDVILPSKD